MSLVDAHVHFDDPRLDGDRQQALMRACRAGVLQMVVPGVTAATFARTREVCLRWPGLYPCYGLHPYFLDRHDDAADLQSLSRWLEQGRPVALGECGLDFFLDTLDRERQFSLFEAQISLARHFDLPLVIHARRALDEVTACLRRGGHHRGMIHSFAGSAQQAKALVDLGFHISFCAALTFERARRLQRVAATLPADALLIETDAPDQPGAAHRGERNEPAYLPEVLAALAALRTESGEQLARITAANARRLFSLPSIA